MTTEQIGYADALAELQQILNELEAEEIDIDLLAVRVERAAELIKFCRGRINDAEVRVSQIVANLDDNNAQADSSDSLDGDDD